MTPFPNYNIPLPCRNHLWGTNTGSECLTRHHLKDTLVWPIHLSSAGLSLTRRLPKFINAERREI